MISSTQFGSICDDIEQKSEVQTVSLTADYDVSEKLNVSFSSAYNLAEEETEGYNLQTPEGFDSDATYDSDGDGVADINNGALGKFYQNWDELNAALPTYSDLKYQQIQVTLGCDYSFTDNLYASAEVGLDKFIDDEAYVYGDQDGTAYRGKMGLGYRF